MTLIDGLPALGLSPAAALEGVHELLDAMTSLTSGEPGPEADYAALVTQCARARARLQALELSLVAAADKARVATDAGAASTSAWHAQVTRTEPAESHRQTKLAQALDSELLATTAQALAAGGVSGAHAAVIAGAIRQLPEGLSVDQVGVVEADLVTKARRMDPNQLRKAARRSLEAIGRSHDDVDAHEDRLLREQETDARVRVRASIHDHGDGTATITARTTTLAASILKKVLDQLVSPRRGRLGATEAQAGSAATANPNSPVFDWARRRGEAFTSLLERLPTDHLGGKVAASVIVRTDLASLRDGLKAAGLDTGEVISAAEARRLACAAGIIPAVLGGGSQLLDLGRTRRFFTETQRTAGALDHETCAADGCETPYAWAELHHRDPWARGGPTDLAEMVPLCGFHHHRIHDPAYHHHTRPDGAITFTRRT